MEMTVLNLPSLLLLFGSLSFASGGYESRNGLRHKETLRVTSVLIEPYLMHGAHQFNGSGNHQRYIGYIPDLLQKIEEIIGVHFRIHEVPDNSFGYRQSDGHWDGMVGELIRRDADVAAAPMYSTKHRAKVIDFTDPYMEVASTLLLRKPPIATELKIKTARDLLSQSEIKYGTLDTGVIIRAFKNTNDTVYRMLWRNMQRFEPSVFTTTNEQGIERVRQEKYAFIIPSSIGEYISMRVPCDLVTVDRFLMKRGYSLAVQKDSPLLADINRALYILNDIGHLDELYRKWWIDRSQCNGIKSSKIYRVQSRGTCLSKDYSLLLAICSSHMLFSLLYTKLS